MIKDNDDKKSYKVVIDCGNIGSERVMYIKHKNMRELLKFIANKRPRDEPFETSIRITPIKSEILIVGVLDRSFD